jgi:hypothetical protein
MRYKHFSIVLLSVVYVRDTCVIYIRNTILDNITTIESIKHNKQYLKKSF